MKNKIITLIIVFLLIVPLRLPISILMIQLFEWIINITTNILIYYLKKLNKLKLNFLVIFVKKSLLLLIHH